MVLFMTLRSSHYGRYSFGSFGRLSSVAALPLQLGTHHRAVPSHAATSSSHESYGWREQSLVALFQRCTTLRDVKQIHAAIIRTGFEQHVFVAGRIISFCSISEQGCMDYAESIFGQFKWPDGFLWNTMIRGCGRTDRAEEAFRFFKRMRQAGKTADNFTFCFLLKICGRLAAAKLGQQLHCCVLKHGLDCHHFVRNTLVHMYGLFGDMDAARRLFEEITNSDVVSWNALLDVCVRCGRYEEALKMFLRMHRNGLQPDDATMVVVLSACSELGALDFGEWVHSLLGSSMLESFASVSNSLIDMYAKCGAIDQAYRVFEGMKQRNVVSWNSMILGLAMHGHPDKALDLFNAMREREMEEPNDITFLGVLCACSHGGLVEEGRRFFNTMRRDYGIPPNIKHYGCMVDLLGRAGAVREAHELIRHMPMEGNAVVWRTLLAACRVHGDIELGEHVRVHLMELEPDHSSDFVLLSHMYAGTGRWNHVLEMRDAMRGRGVVKPTPGNSSISVLSNVARL